MLTLTAELTILNISGQNMPAEWSKLLKTAREEPSRLLVIVHE
jgi:hypothetical protein